MAMVKGTAQSFFDEATCEIESLRDEMENWKDSMETSDGLMATNKYERVEEAYTQLNEAFERLDEVDKLPKQVQDKEVSVNLKKRKRAPRWLRLENAIKQLSEVLEVVETLQSESRVVKDGMTLVDAGLDDIVDDLICAEDELACVEFPGMYG